MNEPVAWIVFELVGAGTSDSGAEVGEASSVDDGTAEGVSSVGIAVGSETEVEEEVGGATVVESTCDEVDSSVSLGAAEVGSAGVGSDEVGSAAEGSADVGSETVGSADEDSTTVGSADDGSALVGLAVADSISEGSGEVLVATVGSSAEDGASEEEVGLLSETLGDADSEGAALADEGRDVTEEAAGLACAVDEDGFRTCACSREEIETLRVLCQSHVRKICGGPNSPPDEGASCRFKARARSKGAMAHKKKREKRETKREESGTHDACGRGRRVRGLGEAGRHLICPRRPYSVRTQD